MFGRKKPQMSESRDIQNQTKDLVLCHYFYRDFNNAFSKLKERRERRTVACLQVRWSPDVFFRDGA